MLSRHLETALRFNRLLICLIVLCFVASGAQALAQKTSVAVIGPEASEPLRSLLTAELSKLPDVAVVERAELGKISLEQDLARMNLNSAQYSRIGKLLHADTLLLLNVDAAKSLGNLRVVSTLAGVDLFGENFKTPLPSVGEWAGLTVRKISPYLLSFGSGAKNRTPLSVLKIRSVVGGLEATRQEQELGFLLVRRLMNEPSLAILERTQMGPLEWENALRANPPSSYLTGSYLLDGSLTVDNQGFSVSARLRPPGGGEAIPLETRGSSVAQLTENLAGLVTAKLKTKHPAKPWNSASEAQQYQQEALWAYRWHLFEESNQAAEAAWALGTRNDTLALLRCASEAEHINSPPIQIGAERLPSFKLGDVILMCDYLSESLAWKGDHLSQTWIGVGAHCLSVGSGVLRSFYYSYPWEPNEELALKAIRGRMRTLCDTLKSAAQHLPPSGAKDSSIDAQLEQMLIQGNLTTVRGVSEPIWQETPEAAVDKVVSLFDELDQLNPHTRWSAKMEFIDQRPEYAPWIAYWHPKDCSRVPFAILRKRLLAAPAQERAIDLALIQFGHRENIEPTSTGGRLDPQQKAAALKEMEATLLRLAPAIARGEVFENRVNDGLQKMNGIMFAEKPGSPFIPEVKEFALTFIKTLLRDPASTDSLLSNLTPQADRLSLEEKQELLKLARSAPGNKIGYIRTLEDYISPPKQIWPDESIKTATGTPLKPSLAVSVKDIIGDAHIDLGGVRQIEEKLWLYGRDMSANFHATPIALYRFDLKTRTSEKIPTPPSSEVIRDLAVIHGQIFAATQREVMQYSPTENQWKDLPLSEMTFPRVWAIDGLLYGAGQPGLIFRFNPATGKSDVLASSRRRPALTILDDVAPYEVSKIFKDINGRLCAMVGLERIVRWDETKRSWEDAFDASKLKGPEGVDRNLLLKAIGAESIQPSLMAPMHPAHGPTNFLVMTSSQARFQNVGGSIAPRAPESRIAPGAFLGSAFDGTTLWWATSTAGGKKAILNGISTADGSKTVLSMGIDLVPSSMQAQWLNATPEGLTFFNQQTAYFFRKEDLASRRANP